jgi:hypothetical protein
MSETHKEKMVKEWKPIAQDSFDRLPREVKAFLECEYHNNDNVM